LKAARLELARSWGLVAAILVLHGLAAASLLTVMQGWVGAALALAMLALGAAAAWARALHRSTASVRAIELSSSGVLLELRDGRRCQAELGGSRHVSRLMVTLPVRRPMRRTILVTRDMLAPEEFRRLRLWALWGKVPGGVAHKQLPARA
jgi:hypothetical protein